MKIAIFSDTFFPQTNGVANMAYQSAKALAKLGHDVVVFIPASRVNKEKIRQAGNFRVVFLPSLPVPVYPGERMAFPFGFQALKEFRNFKFDVIHSHTPFALGWLAIAASKIFSVKLVGTHHTFFDHYLRYVKLDYDWGKKLSWKYTVGYYNRCHVVISPTQSLYAELVEHGLYRSGKVLANFIDTELFHPISKEEKIKLKKKFNLQGSTLVYMGRLSYEKSIDVVIDAFEEIKKDLPKVKLMLVGDGPERKKLERLCKSKKLDDRVIFTGFLHGKKLAGALEASDLFITASKSENMPLSILEAKASGLPVVAVSEKGLREIVEDGVDGFLVPANDKIAMREAILKILQNEILREKMSKASGLTAQKYSSGHITKLLEGIYKSKT